MTNRVPKISVLVPTFNRADFLGPCLESLLAQSLPPHQLLVINDGSTDHTRKALEPFLDRIVYLECRQRGKSNALNTGLEKVSGDYVWIFDDDDVALPDALERFVEPLERQLEFGFSYSSYFFTPSLKGSVQLGRPYGQYPLPDLEKTGPLIPLLENNYLGGAALFARRSCYKKAGLFDEGLVRSQDYEMAIRMVRLFKGVRVRGGPTFHYRQHTGARGSLGDRFDAANRGQKWMTYDQIIFRRLYHDLSLAEYLPPGSTLALENRRALLQRMAMLAIKSLTEEMATDLRELSTSSDTSPFTAVEKALIKKIGGISFYANRSALDDPRLLAELSSLSRTSPVIALLKKELKKHLVLSFVSRPRPSRLARLARSWLV